MKWKLSLLVPLFLMSCATRKNGSLNSRSQLRFLGEYVIPLKHKFKGTTVGGLSGIDYDSKNAVYYLISDDGSKIDPARFYTAKIDLGEKGIDTVALLNVTFLLQPNDSIYPYSAIDPEAIRYHPVKHRLFWSSEGERMVRKEGNVLLDPSIHIQDTDGKWQGSFELPLNMHIQNDERGPRSNGSFEGLAFTNDYKFMYVNVEEPLYEDGPRAGTGDSSAWTRIIKYDVETRKPLAQYAYPIDPVAYSPSPASAFKINGVSEILWVGKDRLLVIERSFSTGRLGCVIKVYLADFSDAEDVSAVVSLKEQKSKKPVSKTLLLNMEALGIPVYNIEGVTFGPQLPNGHKTLVFVADDNFSAVDKTQFLLFEVY